MNIIGKPFPNEHSCRINDPKKYDSFARKNGEQEHDGKKIDVIYGIFEEDGKRKSEIQALRYPKKTWQESEAKAHCKTRKGSFEAAEKCLDCEVTTMDHMKVELKKAKDGVYQAYISPSIVDRDGEMVHPEAVKNVRQYLKSNPVIYYDHAWASFTAQGEERLPIGKAVGYRKTEKGLVIKWVFSELEFAQKVKYLVDEEILNTVSIGFLAKSIENDPDKIKESLKEEGIPTKTIPRRLYTDIELLELSVVGIPANQNAEIIRVASMNGNNQIGKILTELNQYSSKPVAEEKKPVKVSKTELIYRRLRKNIIGD
jgi:hypothetical protein